MRNEDLGPQSSCILGGRIGQQATSQPSPDDGEAEKPELKWDARTPYPSRRSRKHKPAHAPGLCDGEGGRHESSNGVRHDVDLPERKRIEHLSQKDHGKL